VSRINGWWIVLGLLPVILLLSAFSFPDPSHSPRYGKAVSASVSWSFLAIGVRAVIGILRRERSRAWLVYLLLYVLLPVLAGTLKEYSLRLGWIP
jgi:hypothetical protein